MEPEIVSMSCSSSVWQEQKTTSNHGTILANYLEQFASSERDITLFSHEWKIGQRLLAWSEKQEIIPVTFQ